MAENYLIKPSSLRIGSLVMSASNGSRYEVSEDEMRNVNFGRECISGKHLGLPISDSLLLDAFRFQRVDDNTFQKHMRNEVIKIEKRNDEYRIFGRKVEAAHILQGLVFFATGEELRVA